MYIYNIKNKVVTECLNNDIIKICRRDPLNYIVSDDLGSIEQQISSDDTALSEDAVKKVPLSKMKLDDLKALAEELGLESEGLNCDELRKIIKDAQGAQ